MLTISSILERKGTTVHTVRSSESVGNAVDRMNHFRVGSLVVTSNEHAVIGIFTERDILVRIIAAGREPRVTRVGEVMSTELVTVTPDTTLDDAMRLMTHTRHRHLPVTSSGGICGLISIGDITRSMVDERDAQIGDLVHYITHG